MDELEFATLAKEGAFDELYKRSFEEPIHAYKWLLYAVDLGHDDAGEVLGDVEEHVMEFHHGEGFPQLSAHRSLAGEYFHGTHGVRVNLEAAFMHLDEYLLGITGMVMEEDAARAATLEELSEGLDEPLRVQLERFVAELPFRLVKWRVDRIVRLRGLGAPQIIVESECQRLQQHVDALVQLVGAG